jgi:hypothetical protein
VKWPKAVAKIVDDVEPLLAFYDFLAEHWIHLKTTNPIEPPNQQDQEGVAIARPWTSSPRLATRSTSDAGHASTDFCPDSMRSSSSSVMPTRWANAERASPWAPRATSATAADLGCSAPSVRSRSASRSESPERSVDHAEAWLMEVTPP